MAHEPDDEVAPNDRVRRHVWVQNVAVSAAALRGRLRALAARSSGDRRAEIVAEEVDALLSRALAAAYRDNPMPTRWANWWRGSLYEASYQHLHAAEAEITMLYDDAEVESEVAEAVARVDASLNRDDPRRAAAHALPQMPPGSEKRALLRKVIEIGNAASDRQHARVRSFRNVVLVAATLIALFVAVFVAVVAVNPAWVPLCFQNGATAAVCPTGADSAGGGDVFVVALLGLTGGAVAAAVSIRNLRGTATPYDVPVALAYLKVPLGALTALVGLIAIRGEFVPGVSALDSQEQLLAYAVALGYAQQALTTWIDRRAQEVLNRVPSKDAETTRPALDDWAFAPASPAVRSATSQPA
jgi:hypothetical protein